jgi:HSP20 family protein
MGKPRGSRARSALVDGATAENGAAIRSGEDGDRTAKRGSRIEADTRRGSAMSGIETAVPAGGEDAIGQAIAQMEKLYRAVTGREAPPLETGHAPIPAEKDPVRHVEEQMDRLLGMMGRSGLGSATVAWTPPLSVWEVDNEVVICLDVPGVSRENLRLQLEGNLLTVAGERPVPSYEGGRLQWSERPVGTFRRTVPLPPIARNREPTAQIRDGVLEVHVPRDSSSAGPPRTISIG